MISIRHLLLISLIAPSIALSDVINHSAHVVYVDDEDLGMIWMVPPGATYQGENDAVASPFIKRDSIYKTVNDENVEINVSSELVPSTNKLESRAAQLLIGGWKDEDWINGPHGYRFRRLYNLTR